MSEQASRAANPQMSDDFARVYEASAHRITGPVSVADLELVGVGPSTRLLDIAAGAGALSIPAAENGAKVTATDVAPGMVRRLAERLRTFPGCEAREMDGEALEFGAQSFDAAFSIFGVMLVSDWRRGLREQARVLRVGGKGCVATWRDPPGGGPFVLMALALRSIFPDRPPPSPPEGMAVLSDPGRLEAEMRAGGFDQVEVREIQSTWKGPAGDAYFKETEALHRYMRPYAALDESGRARVRSIIRSLLDERTVQGTVALPSAVLLAVGTRA